MNDLRDLKRAMQSPPGFTARELDLGDIMQAGGRLRRRRRLAVGSAAAVAVVALLVGGSQLIGGRPVAGAGTPIAPGAGPAPTAGATARPDPAPSDPAADKPLGDVIRTGLTAKDGAWVLYAVPVDEPALPDTHFGIMLGVRQPGGHIVPSVESNEVTGSALAPGFHGGEASQVVDGRTTLTFGYYVGEPSRIQAKAEGRTITARTGVWSQDPSVTMYWFSTADAGPDARVTGVTAYDRRGKELPSGNAGFGVG
jgi:hypothetical protein